MLDGGFDPTQALIDCINAGELRLAITLMAKIGSDASLQKCDAKGRNLFHHLAGVRKYQFVVIINLMTQHNIFNTGKLHGDASLFNTLANKLLLRSVNSNVIDKRNRSPLHVACKHLCHAMISFLIAQKDIDVNLVLLPADPQPIQFPY